MFGLTFDKLIVIGVIAVVLIGPTRLPRYAALLGKWVRNLRSFADGAKDRMREEMGPEFDDIDWKKLDPRQYDPRRIIRDALLDDGSDDDPDPSPRVVRASSEARPASTSSTPEPALAGSETPFDSEAT